MLTPGPKIRTPPPKSVPRPEKTEDAHRKTMQNPALEKSNGAIQHKLWPKTMLGGTSQNPGVCKGGFERKKLMLHCKIKEIANISINFLKNGWVFEGQVHFVFLFIRFEHHRQRDGSHGHFIAPSLPTPSEPLSVNTVWGIWDPKLRSKLESN